MGRRCSQKCELKVLKLPGQGRRSYLWAGGPGQGGQRQCWCSQKCELKDLKLPGQGRSATCGQEVQDKENEGDVGAARNLN